MKKLSWLDDDGVLQTQLLDIDGSLSTTKACAKAIQASLKKVSLGGRKIVLKGQTTDSGGGGVLDKLADELEVLGLTVEKDLYYVGACAIHCLQLQLSGPTNALIGEGGVDKRNAIQMLRR